MVLQAASWSSLASDVYSLAIVVPGRFGDAN